MLQSVKIGGFKTLKDFDLVLKPGINALVGINGAGKTNILQGLEFCSHLVRSSLYEIPSLMDCEVEELFDLKTDINEIDVELSGTDLTYCRDLTSSQVFDEHLNNFIPLRTDFVFKFKVGLNFGIDSPLIFINQILNFDFKLNINSQVINNKFAFQFSKGVEKITKFEMAEMIKFISPRAEYITSHTSLSTSKLNFTPKLIELSEKFYPISSILLGVNFNKAYDIYPAEIRNEGASKVQFGIKYNGCGLPSTLLNLQEYAPEKFAVIEESMKLISSDLEGLEVTYNELSNQIKVITKQTIDESNSFCEIPLNLLADGMLKWFSLMTAFEFSNENFLIDEPENFLDFRMQHELMEFFRLELAETDRVCIIATHSETFMNTLTPDEISYISIKNGVTRADRVADPEKLLKRIGETGKSLGRYYISGSLELFLENYDD